jgi:hypothetical protein
VNKKDFIEKAKLLTNLLTNNTQAAITPDMITAIGFPQPEKNRIDKFNYIKSLFQKNDADKINALVEGSIYDYYHELTGDYLLADDIYAIINTPKFTRYQFVHLIKEALEEYEQGKDPQIDALKKKYALEEYVHLGDVENILSNTEFDKKKLRKTIDKIWKEQLMDKAIINNLSDEELDNLVNIKHNPNNTLSQRRKKQRQEIKDLSQKEKGVLKQTLENLWHFFSKSKFESVQTFVDQAQGFMGILNDNQQLIIEEDNPLGIHEKELEKLAHKIDEALEKIAQTKDKKEKAHISKELENYLEDFWQEKWADAGDTKVLEKLGPEELDAIINLTEYKLPNRFLHANDLNVHDYLKKPSDITNKTVDEAIEEAEKKRTEAEVQEQLKKIPGFHYIWWLFETKEEFERIAKSHTYPRTRGKLTPGFQEAPTKHLGTGFSGEKNKSDVTGYLLAKGYLKGSNQIKNAPGLPDLDDVTLKSVLKADKAAPVIGLGIAEGPENGDFDKGHWKWTAWLGKGMSKHEEKQIEQAHHEASEDAGPLFLVKPKENWLPHNTPLVGQFGTTTRNPLDSKKDLISKFTIEKKRPFLAGETVYYHTINTGINKENQLIKPITHIIKTTIDWNTTNQEDFPITIQKEVLQNYQVIQVCLILSKIEVPQLQIDNIIHGTYHQQPSEIWDYNFIIYEQREDSREGHEESIEAAKKLILPISKIMNQPIVPENVDDNYTLHTNESVKKEVKAAEAVLSDKETTKTLVNIQNKTAKEAFEDSLTALLTEAATNKSRIENEKKFPNDPKSIADINKYYLVLEKEKNEKTLDQFIEKVNIEPELKKKLLKQLAPLLKVPIGAFLQKDVEAYLRDELAKAEQQISNTNKEDHFKRFVEELHEKLATQHLALPPSIHQKTPQEFEEWIQRVKENNKWISQYELTSKEVEAALINKDTFTNFQQFQKEYLAMLTNKRRGK